MRACIVLGLVSLFGSGLQQAQTPSAGGSEGLSARVQSAIHRSTLDQVGTPPFHLKAKVAPTLPGDSGSGERGSIEIWWVSPTHWRREVHSPVFSQVQIVDGDKLWQRTQGNYFPAWLRETATELIQPVPQEADVLAHLEHARVTDVQDVTSASWEIYTGPDHQRVATFASISLNDKSGLLYGGFNKFLSFHGLEVPSVLALGDVTATMTTLEDLGTVPPALLDATAPGSDEVPLRVEQIPGPELLRHLMPGVIRWPVQTTGPLRGTASALLEVDRWGNVGSVSEVVVDNPGLTAAAAKIFAHMTFSPIRQDGREIQAISRVEIPFSTTRPNGGEQFDPANVYLEQARAVNFPATKGNPYLLRATFELPDPSGTSALGRYEDTFWDATHWRREAWVHESHIVRSQDGSKRFSEADGPDAPVLYMVLHVLEPLPAPGTLDESVWRIQRDTVDGLATLRLAYGPEDASGQLDPAQSQGFWIGTSGRLLRAVSGGVDVLRSDFQPFDGAQVAQSSVVRVKGGGVALRIQVRSMTLLTSEPPEWRFYVKGFEARRPQNGDVR